MCMCIKLKIFTMPALALVHVPLLVVCCLVHCQSRQWLAVVPVPPFWPQVA